MAKTTVNSRAVKTLLSRRAKGAARVKRARFLSQDDPLLNLDAFAVKGTGGKLTNAKIDCILYRKP
jgi:hypothetical protein